MKTADAHFAGGIHMLGVVFHILFQRHAHVVACGIHGAGVGDGPLNAQHCGCDDGAADQLLHGLVQFGFLKHIVVGQMGLTEGNAPALTQLTQLLDVGFPVVIAHPGVGIHALAEVDVQNLVATLGALLNAELHGITHLAGLESHQIGRG